MDIICSTFYLKFVEFKSLELTSTDGALHCTPLSKGLEHELFLTHNVCGCWGRLRRRAWCLVAGGSHHSVAIGVLSGRCAVSVKENPVGFREMVLQESVCHEDRRIWTESSSAYIKGRHGLCTYNPTAGETRGSLGLMVSQSNQIRDSGFTERLVLKWNGKVIEECPPYITAPTHTHMHHAYT